MKLRAHQQEAVDWLLTKSRGYLGDAPRVGKALALLTAAKQLGGRPLIICPAIVQTHWHREAAQVGTEAPLVYSYDAIQRGGNELMRRVMAQAPSVIITDEHHYLKHSGSKRTHQILGTDGYLRRADVAWQASGTPVPRHLGEMWTTLAALYPQVLIDAGVGTRRGFEDHFLIKRGSLQRGVWVEKVVGQQNQADFKAMLAPIMLRRTLRDLDAYADVPDVDWQVLTVDAAHHAFTDVATAERVSAALVAGRLEQIAADPHVASMRRRLGELKAGAVVELLRDQMAEGDGKVVVFAHHRDALDVLRRGLFTYGVSYVDGDTSRARRDEAIDAFQTDPARRVFLGQTIACKEGLTLDAADVCYLVEPDWASYVNEQAGKRILNTVRVGRKCVVQLVALAGTLDEGIVRQNRREIRMVDEILT